MNLHTKILTLAATFFLLSQGIVTGAVLRPLPAPPNLFELVGKKLEISYATSSFAGEPRLSYNTPTQSLDFAGDEIRQTRTEIGQLVTVTINQVPDLKTVTLTLLIPEINLPTDGDGVAFKTKAIFTTHPTTIAGRELVEGPLQTYRVKALLGKASRVEFFQRPEAVVIGEVTLSPTCGGPQRPGQICEKPFAGAVVQLFDQFDTYVDSTKTNEKGLFELSAAPGEYMLRVETPGRLPSCPETPVRVPEDGKVMVEIDCDTGIR